MCVYFSAQGGGKMLYILVVVLVISVSFVVLALYNKYLPVWFCEHIGWHLEPARHGFDGCSCFGVCPRCQKFVLQDS